MASWIPTCTPCSECQRSRIFAHSVCAVLRFAVVSSAATSLFASISVPSASPLAPSTLDGPLSLEDETSSNHDELEETLFRKSLEPSTAVEVADEPVKEVRASSALSTCTLLIRLLSADTAAGDFSFADRFSRTFRVGCTSASEHTGRSCRLHGPSQCSLSTHYPLRPRRSS